MAGLEFLAGSNHGGTGPDALEVVGMVAAEGAMIGVGAGIGALAGGSGAVATGAMIGFMVIPGALAGVIAAGAAGVVLYGGYRLAALPFERFAENGERIREIQVRAQNQTDTVTFPRMDREAFDRFIETLTQHAVVHLNLNGLKRVRRWMWNAHFSGADLSRLARHMNVTRLETVNVSGIGLTEAAANDFVAALRGAHHLQTLNVSGNHLKGSAFAILGLTRSHGTLSRLTMSKCDLALKDFIPGEEGMPLLAGDELQREHRLTIDLGYNPLKGSVTEIDAIDHHFAALFNRVAHLDLTRTKGASTVVASSFGRLFHAVQECVMASAMYSSRQLASMFQEWRAHHTALTRLDLSHVKNLDDDFFVEMLQFLRSDQTLRNLSLAAASIKLESQDTLTLFGRTIKQHQSLQQVDCKGVFTKKSEITAFYHGFDEALGRNRGVYHPHNKAMIFPRTPPAGSTITVVADWHKLDHLKPKDSGCSVM